MHPRTDFRVSDSAPRSNARPGKPATGHRLMTLPSEIVGKIIDNVLAPYDIDEEQEWKREKDKGYLGLIKVNAYLKSEFDAAVRRSNWWVRTICYDENDGYNKIVMKHFNQSAHLQCSYKKAAVTRPSKMLIKDDMTLLYVLNTWIHPSIKDVTNLLFGIKVRLLPSFTHFMLKSILQGCQCEPHRYSSTWFLVKAFVRLSRDLQIGDHDSHWNCVLACDDFQACFQTLRYKEGQRKQSEVNKMMFCDLSDRLKRVGVWPRDTPLEETLEALFKLGAYSSRFWKGFQKSFAASRARRLARLDN